MRKQGYMVRAASYVAALGLVVGAARPAMADKDDWRSSGQNIQNTRSNEHEHEIGARNVGDLEVKWSFQAKGDISATPVVEDGAVYVPDWGGYIHRVDARTGKAVWSKSIEALTGIQGAVSRTAPALTDDLAIFGTQNGATVLAVRKRDGVLVWATRVSDHPLAVVTGSPLVYRGHVYGGVASMEEGAAADPNYPCCSFRGSAYKLDLKNGHLDWQTFMVPQGYTGGSVWSSTPAVDEKRHQLIVTTGNNYSVPKPVDDCVNAANGDAKKIDACMAKDNYFDSIVAIDLESGYINWGRRAQGFDAWTVACFNQPQGVTWCPSPEGPDYDFGSGPNLFTAKIGGKHRDVVGAGQKSGIYWAVDAENGDILWSTLVGPGSSLGGIEWGTAYEDGRIYVSQANYYQIPFALQPSGKVVSWGGYSAIDAATGKLLWQIADPTEGAADTGFVSAANGVMYAGSLDAQGHYYAIDGRTGKILWSYASGGSVVSGAAISDGRIYWGSGYAHFGLGTPGGKLYAFGLPGRNHD